MTLNAAGLASALIVGAGSILFVLALVVGPTVAARRQRQAQARVTRYVTRQQQARTAEAAGRHNLAAVLRGHPAAGTVVDVEAIAEELEAPDPEPFTHYQLDAWPLEVSETGHPPASHERIVLGFDGSRSSDAIVTAAQPAAVVDRTGVVLELYPPAVERPPAQPCGCASAFVHDHGCTKFARPRPAGSEQHPAGQGRHVAPVVPIQRA